MANPQSTMRFGVGLTVDWYHTFAFLF